MTYLRCMVPMRAAHATSVCPETAGRMVVLLTCAAQVLMARRGAPQPKHLLHGEYDSCSDSCSSDALIRPACTAGWSLDWQGLISSPAASRVCHALMRASFGISAALAALLTPSIAGCHADRSTGCKVSQSARSESADATDRSASMPSPARHRKTRYSIVCTSLTARKRATVADRWVCLAKSAESKADRHEMSRASRTVRILAFTAPTPQQSREYTSARALRSTC